MTISTEEKKAFLYTPLNKSFGADRSKAIERLKQSNTRFVYWLGGDETKINQVFDEVEKMGVSWEYFAAKAIQEGFSSGLGWHNHTYVNGDYLTDLRSVIEWTKGVAAGGYPLAYNDPYGGTTGIQAKAEADADYAAIPTGTIGKAYLAMTAAAVWATWMPDYLATTPFGDPIQGSIDLIKSWGGKITDNNGKTVGGGTNNQTNTNPNRKPKNKKKVQSGLIYLANSIPWMLRK